METPIQDNVHGPVPMVEEVKKMTQRDIFELFEKANEEEEPGQQPDVYFYRNIRN